ncbi:MAG TPA: GH3 auxin-responsive promoter [Bacteroidetes bacterium]|nr:GH3 auxin-responsive promoter [Bacteroidota bacterium]
MPIKTKNLLQKNNIRIKLKNPLLDPVYIQKRVLKRLLAKSVNTEFGKHYEFDKILNGKNFTCEFQSKIPIHDYDKIYNEWWHKSLECNMNETWRGKAKYFALSSGTTGNASKYIPITRDIMNSMAFTGMRLFTALSKLKTPRKIYLKNWLMIGGSATLKEEKGCYVGDLSGINAKKNSYWTKPYYKPGLKIAKMKNWDDRLKAIAMNAHKWDIGVVSGIPSWVQLTLEYVIKENKLKNIHEIWPNLSVFITGGTAFEPYKNSFEALLDHPLTYIDTYLASEGFIAYQNRIGTNAMKMILNGGIFYEFVPFNDDNFDESGNLKSKAQALHIGEIEENIDYALLLTTNAGAWRYLIGDTIRFTDKSKNEIIITGRTKHFLSVCGEHLSVDNMNQAIKKVENELNLNIKEFTVGAVKKGSHFTHRWYIGTEKNIDKTKLSNALDNFLCELNDDYKAERSAMLHSPEINVLPNEVFYNWQRHIGKMNGQSKIPRVLNQKNLNEWENYLSNNF